MIGSMLSNNKFPKYICRLCFHAQYHFIEHRSFLMTLFTKSLKRRQRSLPWISVILFVMHMKCGFFVATCQACKAIPAKDLQPPALPAWVLEFVGVFHGFPFQGIGRPEWPARLICGIGPPQRWKRLGPPHRPVTRPPSEAAGIDGIFACLPLLCAVVAHVNQRKTHGLRPWANSNKPHKSPTKAPSQPPAPAPVPDDLPCRRRQAPSRCSGIPRPILCP